MARILRCSLVLCAACAATIGCDKPRERGKAMAEAKATLQPGDVVGSAELTGASIIVPSSAITQIADARCAQEQACMNVGSERRYKDRRACRAEISASLEARLKPTDCPEGIDPDELHRCLADIQTEACHSVEDTLERLAACRKGNLCRR